MRVSLDTDLWTSGRLNKLARCFRTTEREALGALVMVYSVTQHAELVTAPMSHLLNTVSPVFETDEDTERFVQAMINARLATRNDDGTVTVRGNQAHVDKLSHYRELGRNGGNAKKLNDSTSARLAHANRSGNRVGRHTLDGEEKNSMILQAHAKRTLSAAVTATVSAAVTQVQDLDQFTSNPLPDPLPFPSPTAKGEGIPSHPADERVQGEKGTRSLGKDSAKTPADQQVPPSANGLHQAVSIVDATAVIAERRIYLAEHRKVHVNPQPSAIEIVQARAIVAKCGGDVRRARLLVRRYIAEDRTYWEQLNWPLSLLASDANLADFDRASALLDRDMAQLPAHQVTPEHGQKLQGMA